MARKKASAPEASPAQDTARLAEIAATVAQDFVHQLAPAFRPPARLVCPSEAAEQAVIDAVIQVATTRGMSCEVIDLRPAPAERLAAVTARLDGWDGDASQDTSRTMPTVLILRGFDVFGDDEHDAPTYPFRSEFQFDRKFLWLFIGRDWRRMGWLFGSYRRPLYHAAGDITPEEWRAPEQHAVSTLLRGLSEEGQDRRVRQGLADVEAVQTIPAEDMERRMRRLTKPLKS
jgi:hypothetical protein